MELLILILWMIGFPISQRICEYFDRKFGWNPIPEKWMEIRKKELVIYFFIAGAIFFAWVVRFIISIVR